MKWCKFHNDHGHRVDECIALRLELTELLKQGHLKDLLINKEREKIDIIFEQQGERRAPTPPAQP